MIGNFLPEIDISITKPLWRLIGVTETSDQCWHEDIVL